MFWTAYAIVVVFQLLTNGWLTGRDIVTYDDAAILGVRGWSSRRSRTCCSASRWCVQTLAWWVWWGRRLRRGSGGRAAP